MFTTIVMEYYEEYSINIKKITKQGKDSYIVIGKVQSKYNNLTINEGEEEFNERQ